MECHVKRGEVVTNKKFVVNMNVDGLVSPPLSQMSLPSSMSQAKSFVDLLATANEPPKNKRVPVPLAKPKQLPEQKAKIDHYLPAGNLQDMVGRCVAIQPNLEPLIVRDDRTRKLFAGKWTYSFNIFIYIICSCWDFFY